MDTDNRSALFFDEEVDLDFQVTAYKGKNERALAGSLTQPRKPVEIDHTQLDVIIVGERNVQA